MHCFFITGLLLHDAAQMESVQTPASQTQGSYLAAQGTQEETHP